MCGLIAYIGNDPALPLLIEGLRKLEYRGYDSAGIGLLGAHLRCYRTSGGVENLMQCLPEDEGERWATIGLGHTRWATHGEPSEVNAHPHVDDAKLGHGIALVHNGIIENHATLRTYLRKKGHVFLSDTDTEVLAHLVGDFYDGDLEDAVRSALCEVNGAFAIAVLCVEEPESLVVARRGSPLMVGVGEGEYVVASDAAAIVSRTTHAFILEEDSVARITREGFRTTTLQNVPVTPRVSELECDLQQIELGGHEHFMLKEICEQPEVLRTCMRGRMHAEDGRVVLGGIDAVGEALQEASRVIFIGQGTAYHAGQIAASVMETLARIPSSAEFASEFRYRNPVLNPGTVVIAISQSGETADTLAAVNEARSLGALTLGAVNVVGSSIARATDAGVYLRVGPEIGVASTKAFLGQLMATSLLAINIGIKRSLPEDEAQLLLDQLVSLPEQVETMVSTRDTIRRIAARYAECPNWLYLGRGLLYPIAMEGALKLKEISYLHAEGMPAAEMKHGPIALIDDGMPVVCIALQGRQYEKILSNIEEVRARGGSVIAVATEGDDHISEICDDIIPIPDVTDVLQPFLSVVPLQLLAYHVAVLLDRDVDRPRNLAKSVTVE